MKIKSFKLERYFAKYEFSVKYLLSSSDCDGIAQRELLKMADSESEKLWKELKLGYTESLGYPLLREEIAELNSKVSKDEILVVVPEEGIFIALNTLLEKGDHVISTFPGYQSLYQIAESIGCAVSKWRPEEKSGWKFKIEDLEKSITNKTKLIVINFPHNPTGYLPPKSDFEKIVKLAKANDIYLLSDEMYRFLELDEENRLPFASEVYDKAISLYGMSKTFGMAGVRIGWLATKDKTLYKNFSDFKDYTTICSSAPSEILSIIALRNKEKIIADNLKKINRNLSLLDDFFARQKSRFDWVRPKAGTIGFPRIKNDISALDFCQDVVKNANIMLLPSTVYDYGNSHFRIGFGRDNMPDALSSFEKYLNKSYRG